MKRTQFEERISQREDFKLYSQLPYYDDFRGYDLGIEEQLERASTLILPTSINIPVELRIAIFSRKRRREIASGN